MRFSALRRTLLLPTRAYNRIDPALDHEVYENGELIRKESSLDDFLSWLILPVVIRLSQILIHAGQIIPYAFIAIREDQNIKENT